MKRTKKYVIWLLLIFLLSGIKILPAYSAEDDTSTPPDIDAKAAVVYDLDSGTVLYDKNKDKTMYPASITKLMTALLVLDRFQPDDIITYSENAIDSLDSGSTSVGIRPGEELTFDQSIHALLLMSDNASANALAEAYSGDIESFVEAMNEKAEAIGAVNTHFTNPHGLYDPDHYTTAYDMALITKEVLKNDYFLEIMKDTMYEIPATNKSDEVRYLAQQHKMLNTQNDLSIYRDDVIAGKVGYTTESGNTLVTVATNGDRTVIVVVLDDKGTSLYDDTAQLIDYGYVAPIPEITQTVEDVVTVDIDLTSPVDNLKSISSLNKTDSESTASSSVSNQKKKHLSLWIKVPLIIILLFVLYLLYARESRRRHRLRRQRERLRRMRRN